MARRATRSVFSAGASSLGRMLRALGRARSATFDALEPLEPRQMLSAVSWDGGGDGRSWLDPRNWSDDRLPSVRDEVLIDGGRVRLEGGASVRVGSVRVGAGASLELAGRVRARMNVTIEGTIDLAGWSSLVSAAGLVRISGVVVGDGPTFSIEGVRVVVARGASVAGGAVQISASRRIDVDGLITARSIVLDSGASGATRVGGTLDASNTLGAGGRVHVLGARVGLFGAANIRADGTTDGGEVLVGGERQGRGPVRSAWVTFVGPDVRIDAGARTVGDGGRVIVWADHTSRVYGFISARGGERDGGGGFVETSGRVTLDVTRTPDITSPSGGAAGTWLLDPNNITIAAGSASTNISGGNPFNTSANAAVLGVDLIRAAMLGGSSVIVLTGTGGANSEAGNITLATTLDFDGRGTNSLVLSAHNDIILNAPITDSSGAGDRLNLTLEADRDLSGAGSVRVNAPVSLGGGTFVSRGVNFTNSATINASSMSFVHTGSVTLSNAAPVVLAASSISGDFTLTATASGIGDGAGAAVSVGGVAMLTTTQTNATITLNQLSAGQIRLATAGAGGHATIRTTGSAVLGLSAVGGNLSVTAGSGDVADAGPVSVGGTAAFTTQQPTGRITLGQLDAGGTVFLTTLGDASVTLAGALVLGASSVDGNLSLTARGGGITDIGVVTVGGNLAVSTELSGAGFTLDAVRVSGSVSASTVGASSSATLVNAIALTLGTSNLGGAYAVRAASGGVSDTGVVGVGGALTVTTGGAAVTLDQLSVVGPVLLNVSGVGGNVTLASDRALILGAGSVSGWLNASSSAGGIGDAGSISVAGAVTLATSGASSAINLSRLTPGGSVTITTASAAATIAVPGAITIASAQIVGGPLSVTAGGAITAGGIVSAPSATFVAGSPGSGITLSSVSVAGTIGVSTLGVGANVSITSSGNLALAPSTVGGNLTLVSGGGTITDAGTVTVAGNLSATTIAGNRAITLDSLAVAGVMTFSTSGGVAPVTIVNAQFTTLGPSSVAGFLDVTASVGGLVDVGTVGATGGRRFAATAPGAKIVLDQLSGTGALFVSTVGPDGDATIANTGALTLSGASVGGRLVLSATGPITDTGVVAAGAGLSVTTSPDNPVTLDALSVSGPMTLNTPGTAGTVQIVNDRALVLGASSVGGSLSATALAGGMSDSGLVSVGFVGVFVSSQAGADVILDSLAVGGAILPTLVGTGADLTIVNAGGVAIDGWNVPGNLVVTAQSGPITQTGTLIVGGGLTLTTSSAGQSISAPGLSVAGAIGVNTVGAGGNAAIVNAISTTLGPSSVGGTLSVTVQSGSLADAGVVTVVGSAAFTLQQPGRTITLDTLAVSGQITLSTTGAGADAVIVNTPGVWLAASSVGGSLGVTSSAGGIVDLGTISVPGNASFASGAANGTIAVDTLAVQGTIALSTVGPAGNATVVNAGGVTLGVTTVGGSLTIGAGGSVGDSGAVVVGGNLSVTTQVFNAGVTLDALTVAGSISASTTGTGGTVTLDNTGSIVLGTVFSGGVLRVRSAFGMITDAGSVVVASGGGAFFTTSAAGGVITLDAIAIDGPITLSTTGAGSHATVVSAGGVLLALSSVSGDLTVSAGGAGVADVGAIVVGGSSRFTASSPGGTIVLMRLNAAGPVGFSTIGAAGDVEVVNARALVLGASTIGGSLWATTTVGGISDAGVVSIAGDAAFTTLSSGAAIALDSLAVGGLLSLSQVGAASSATIVNAGPVVLGAWTLPGSLSVTTQFGGITQAGTTSVGGNVSLATLQSGATIAAGQLNAGGTVSLRTVGPGGHASIASTQGVRLAQSNVDGDLAVATSFGLISDAGIVAVGGTLTLTNTQAGGVVTLSQLDVFGAISIVSGGATTLVNARGVTIAGGSVGGTLAITATSGNIADVGKIQLAGASTFRTLAPNAGISLTRVAASGPVALFTVGAAGDATLTNSTVGTTLAASNVGGRLTVTAAAGALTDDGTVVVGGGASFTTLTPSTNILLDTLNVAGSITLSTQGVLSGATIVNAGAVDLASSTLGGTLTVTASAGGITDSGVITLPGRASFSVVQPGAAIVLDQLQASGAIVVSAPAAGASATIVNHVSVDLGAWVVGGDLSVTSVAGSITDSGSASVGGRLTLRTLSSGAFVAVDQLGSIGSVAMWTVGSGGDAIVRTSGALVLGASSVGGRLTATAAGGNLTDTGVVSVLGAAGASLATLAPGASIVLDTLSVAGPISPVTAAVGGFGGTGGDATIINAFAVNLASWQVQGRLTLTATTGGITDSGTSVVGGDATFTTLAPNAPITLDSTSVGGRTGFVTSGPAGHVAYIAPGAVTLSSTSVGGTLSVVAAGPIADAGPVVVAGASSFQAVAPGAAITLDTFDPAGAVSAATTASVGGGSAVTIITTNGLTLAGGTVAGLLSVTARRGFLVTSGPVVVAGDASFATLESSARIIVSSLSAAGGVSVATVGSGGDASVVSTGSVRLAGASVGGALSVTALAGAITDSGPIVVAGAGTFSTAAAGQTIVLDQLDVAGTLAASTVGSGDATLVNARATTLGGMAVGGRLRVTALAGTLSDAGTVTVLGNAVFTTLEPGASITLDTLAVSGFITPITAAPAVGGADVTLVNAGGVVIGGEGAWNVSGDLSVTAATGSIVDADAAVVRGNASFRTAGVGGSITLGQLQAHGTIALFTAGSADGASVTNFASGAAAGIRLASSSVGGLLWLTAPAGGITTLAPVVAGAISATTTQSFASVTLTGISASGPVSVSTLGDATITSAAALVLGPGSIVGSASVTAPSVTQTGVLVVGGASSFTAGGSGGLLLDRLAAIGPVTLSSAGGALVVNDRAISLAGANVAGELSVTAGGAVSDTGAVVAASVRVIASGAVSLDQLDVAGAVRVSTPGGATLVSGRALTIGASDVGGALVARSTGGGITVQGAVVVGGDASFETVAGQSPIALSGVTLEGALSIRAPGAGSSVTVVSPTDVTLGAWVIGGSLSVIAAGPISDAAVASIGGSVGFTVTTPGAGISLTRLAVQGSVSVTTSGGDATVSNAGNLRLGTSSVNGSLQATSRGGEIATPGLVYVSGTARFTTTTAGAGLNLTNLDVRGAITPVTTGAANVTIENIGGVELAGWTVGGNLRVVSWNGDVIDSALSSVAGSAFVRAARAGASVRLELLSVAGPIGVASGGDASIVNAGPVVLDATSVAGRLSVRAATGGISDRARVAVAGGATFVTAQANQPIVLDQLAVAGLITPVSTGVGGVTIVNEGAVVVSGWNVGGDLSLSSFSGSITDTGVSNIGGALTVRTSGAGAVISLTRLNLSGPASITASGDASIESAQALVLSSASVAGRLWAFGASGIRSAGSIVVAGDATFGVRAANSTLTLDRLSVAGAVLLDTTVGSAAKIVDDGALVLGTSSVRGTLDASTLSGSITTRGTVRVLGRAVFAPAAGFALDLSQLDAVGPVTATTIGASASIVNAGPLSVESLSIGGTLSLRARTGDITNAGPIVAGGPIALTADSGGATLVFDRAVDLGTVSVAGGLAISTTAGGIATFGPMSVGGTASFSTLAPGAGISLADARLVGPVSFSTVAGGAVNVAAVGPLVFGASTVAGPLTASVSGGGITDAGRVVLSGRSSFTASTPGSAVLLDQLSAVGAVSVFTSGAAGAVTILNDRALRLNRSIVGGNLTLTTTTGSISAAARIDAAGRARFVTRAENAAITLRTLNARDLAINTRGDRGNVTITALAGVLIRRSTISGSFTLTARSGNIDDAGRVVVRGDAVVRALSEGASIRLDQTTVLGQYR
jgi:trimeric autotransporter adhesin